MTDAAEIEFLAPGAPVDLDNCAREPIHVPGSIQPRGVLLVVSDPAHVVEQASENLEQLTGVPWGQALGRPLADVLGGGAADAVIRSASAFGDLRERNPVELVLDVHGVPDPVDAVLHRAVVEGRRAAGRGGATEGAPTTSLVVELEPARGPRPFSFPNTYQAVRGTVADLNRAASLQELYDITAQAVRDLTGFDRVMVYRYDADYNGEVVAEAKLEELNSFLGQHYPASDIPAQARALYEKNWIRLISDVDYEPSPVRPTDHPASGQPLDMTYSTLRSVSPIHLEYLGNMGVRASMSISLLRDDKLWGLIACHHYSGPHAPPYATRAAAEFLGSTLSLRLVDRAEEDEVRRAMRVRATLTSLTAAALDEDRRLTDTLLGSPDLLDLLPADGVVVRLQGLTGSSGAEVPLEVADAIAAWAAGRGDDVVATDSLGRDAPSLSAPEDVPCGALVLPLPEGQYVLWLRGEAVRHVDWGGDPHNKAIAERQGEEIRLSPRKSFERWREVVRGRSQPWTTEEVAEAAELRTHLLEALYARSRSVVRAAETLQRSLLTEPVQPDGLELAVRYVPAAREAQVGGDWYDVFGLPDGSTILVIGDVVGHDSQAAATMGQLRGLLRGIAYSGSGGPTEVLTQLDGAIQGLGLGALATVLVGRLERPEGADGATLLRWASAGHLPPLLRSPDGPVRPLDAARAGLLLGVDPTRPRTEQQVLLEPGSTLLLYTDGLVERRDQVFDDGVDLLAAALGDLRDLPVDELCDALLARLLPDGAEDDVALVAVCLRPCGG
ncbi:Bacteriophytochrome (light-regulated signal transduction histidine kinase) [Blastococcus aurantiacus]|uniref:Bacteriophytochrome (Light-regulated signal transduction histidine kinase) n=1 Tax=Blastococcus aurantiacus TaxID=1550231 RepID=A0A1G7IXS8_9ACTN|nr:SpoIIE family protein phosphatase [Blastococcus aurantiacus]SDF17542.1 Bacteriophytochrome (light-regulated signal transduction histidine kinase) [Blastococcus aurantiacus]